MAYFNPSFFAVIITLIMQLIMAVTSHKSTDGMRSYKHTFKIKVSLKMSVMQKAATMSESIVTQVPDI